MIKRYFFSLFAALVAAAPLAAGDIYVSRKLGRNSNSGTAAEPVRNLWKALELAKDGDVIRLAGGSYRGKFNQTCFIIDKPVSIIGGYSDDFTERDYTKYVTLFRGENADNDESAPGLGVFHIEFSGSEHPGDVNMRLDGLVFDDGAANAYDDGRLPVEGLATGAWLEPPAKGVANVRPSPARSAIYSGNRNRAQGRLAIRNCAFVNFGHAAVNVSWYDGRVVMKNNVFVNNRLAAALVTCPSQKGGLMWEFANNVVLFTWGREGEIGGTGNALRNSRGVSANIHDNLVGFSAGAGFDNIPGGVKTKLVILKDNVFFLNRAGDLLVNEGEGAKRVFVEDFEDMKGRAGIEAISGNRALLYAEKLAPLVDLDFADVFLSLKSAGRLEFRPASVQDFRASSGLPASSRRLREREVYFSRYGLERALRLFNARP